jgi:outer membrane lipoprotein SlyB
MTQRWMRGTGMALVVVMLAACATPMASRPIVMQGPGFDQHEYDLALATCRTMIERQMSPDRSVDAALGQVLLGALLGAGIGAAFGGIGGHAGYGATLGTVAGGVAGAGSYGQQAQARQAVYDHALSRCLGEKGYQVLGVGR